MVRGHDSGVLLLWPVIIIIITLICLLFTELNTFYIPTTNPTGLVINDIIFELMYTFLNVMTYIIICMMITDFKFTTQVD